MGEFVGGEVAMGWLLVVDAVAQEGVVVGAHHALSDGFAHEGAQVLHVLGYGGGAEVGLPKSGFELREEVVGEVGPVQVAEVSAQGADGRGHALLAAWAALGGVDVVLEGVERTADGLKALDVLLHHV